MPKNIIIYFLVTMIFIAGFLIAVNPFFKNKALSVLTVAVLAIAWLFGLLLVAGAYK